jgi:ABC-type multidrug transport system fused ATPase/permease subunit
MPTSKEAPMGFSGVEAELDKNGSDVATPTAPSTIAHQPLGLFETAFMSWVPPYVVKGFSKTLLPSEMPPLDPSFGSVMLSEQAEKLWAEEVERGTLNFWRVIWRMQPGECVVGIVVSVLEGLLNTVARPLLLQAVIKQVMRSDTEADDAESMRLVVVFAAIVFFEGLLQVNVKQILSSRAGCKFIAWSSVLLYKKAIRAKPGHDMQVSNLIGNDVIQRSEDWKWGCFLLMCCVGLVGGVATLIYLLGTPALVGLGVMAFALLANVWGSQYTKRADKRALMSSDKRVKLMREIVTGIKAIKFMAWEMPYLDKINSERHKETGHIKHFRFIQVLAVTSGRVSPIIAACATFVYMGVTGHTMSPDVIFASISAFQALRMPLITIPMHIVTLQTMRVSFERIGRFLTLPEVQPHESLPTDAAGEDAGMAVVCEGASCRHHRGEEGVTEGEGADTPFTLHMPSLRLPLFAPPTSPANKGANANANGHLVAVIGKVGSGKSSLLQAILGELEMVSVNGGHTGRIARIDSVAYVPQRAFIMSGTIRENILMGQPMDQIKYADALDRSDLTTDLQELPDASETEVGERGTTLSGGQMQRLSIARALYSERRLVVLDDPLSAVDAAVAQRIFAKAVLASARGTAGGAGGAGGRPCTVVMALNQLEYLPHFDTIVHMHGGKVAAHGTLAEIRALAEDEHDGAAADLRDLLPVAQESQAAPPRSTRSTRVNSVDSLPKRCGHAGEGAGEGAARGG